MKEKGGGLFYAKHISGDPGREAYHSPPSSVEVKNVWGYISSPQYAFMAWCSLISGDTLVTRGYNLPRFEPGTSRMQSISVNHLTMTIWKQTFFLYGTSSDFQNSDHNRKPWLRRCTIIS
jgi:hypothetical protein